jgi:hypothetical protein
MTTVGFRRPVTKPLLRLGTVKPLPPDPRAYDTFRVTQRFGTPDAYYAEIDRRAGRTPRTHGAVDVGNFRCGDAVVAMAPGTARRVQDNAVALGAKTNALGLVIDHGSGITSEYWHLNGYSVASGAKVTAGQQIGIVGRTGLGDVCHLHVEVKRAGGRIDPEPLMFGTPLIIEEEDVKIPAGLVPLAQGVVGPGNRLRIDPDTVTGSRIIGGDAPIGIGEAKAYWVQIYGRVSGEPYTLGGVAGSEYLWVGVFGSTWFVAAPLVTQIDATGLGRATLPAPPPADCSAQERELAVARTTLSRSLTAAEGAKQAIDATVEALS